MKLNVASWGYNLIERELIQKAYKTASRLYEYTRPSRGIPEPKRTAKNLKLLSVIILVMTALVLLFWDCWIYIMG